MPFYPRIPDCEPLGIWKDIEAAFPFVGRQHTQHPPETPEGRSDGRILQLSKADRARFGGHHESLGNVTLGNLYFGRGAGCRARLEGGAGSLVQASHRHGEGWRIFP